MMSVATVFNDGSTRAGAMQELPLSGFKVFDATQGIAGPHAGMLLAQQGAEVIKVEPLEGDWGRTLGRRYDDLCAQAITFNRGKRSIAIDLKKDAGLQIARKLAGQSDIVLESYRPGVMKRLGLGYEELSAGRPDLIYLSITGYGQNGSYADLPVTDSVIQAFSGWMTLNRDESGTPMRSGLTVIDVVTGLYAYQAISSAIIGRLRFNRGAYIDCSMLQSAAALQAAKIMEDFLEHGKPQVSYVPVGVMPTLDGYINISAMRDSHFDALCQELGRPDLATNSDFSTRDSRRTNKERLMPILMSEFRKRSSKEWEGKLTSVGVMNSPINTYAEFLKDKHVKEIGTFSEIPHGSLGVVPTANIPGVKPLTPNETRSSFPRIGEHTVELLLEHGYDRDEIRKLQEACVVKQVS